MHERFCEEHGNDEMGAFIVGILIGAVIVAMLAIIYLMPTVAELKNPVVCM